MTMRKLFCVILIGICVGEVIPAVPQNYRHHTVINAHSIQRPQPSHHPQPNSRVRDPPQLAQNPNPASSASFSQKESLSSPPKVPDKIVQKQNRDFQKDLMRFPRGNQRLSSPSLLSNSSSENCERYAYVFGSLAGFGHMMSQVILSYVYALEKGAKPVFDFSKFNTIGEHGQYSWVQDMFDWSHIKDVRSLSLSKYHLIDEKIWHFTPNTNDNPNYCNVVYRTCDECCVTFNEIDRSMSFAQYCYAFKPNFAQISKPFFHPLYRGNTNISILNDIRSKKQIDVLWHIRIGDITLGTNTQKEVVSAVMAQLHHYFADTPLSLILLSEGDITQSPLFTAFAEYTPTVIARMSAKESFELMVESSVLVTSGSAFASIATLFKPVDRTLALQFPAKMNISSGTYDVFDHAIVNMFGKIMFPDENTLNARCTGIKKNVLQL